MNKMIVVTVLAGVLVGGCSRGYYWYKRGNSLQQAEADCTQCYIDSMSGRMDAIHDARQEAKITHVSYISEAEETFGNQLEGVSFTNCMKAKGYREVPTDYLKPSLKKKFCSPTPRSVFNIAGE